MDVIQAYQGYFREEVRFVADNSVVRIPAKKRVIVNVLDDEIVDDARAVDKAEIEKRLEMVKSITGIIPPDVDLDAMRAERIAKRGLL